VRNRDNRSPGRKKHRRIKFTAEFVRVLSGRLRDVQPKGQKGWMRGCFVGDILPNGPLSELSMFSQELDGSADICQLIWPDGREWAFASDALGFPVWHVYLRGLEASVWCGKGASG
jgi:hypothetical protein